MAERRGAHADESVKSSRATLALAALLALAQAAGPARAACVPDPILQALHEADRVRLVRLGPLAERLEGRHDDAPGRFMGVPRIESVEVGGKAAGWLIDAFARGGRIDCSGLVSGEDFSDGARGIVGVEFDTPSGVVRALLMLPGGAIELGFKSGVRFDASLTPAAARDWLKFVDRFTAERHTVPVELFEFLLADQRVPPPVADSTVALGPGKSGCDLPPFSGSARPPLEVEPLTRVAAAYPDLAREAGVSGTVNLAVLVDCDGAVRDVRVLKSIPMLDAAAVAAVRQWKFPPLRRDGRPVADWFEVPVKFSLH